MFLLGRPSAELVRHFIEQQRPLPFTYSEVGATRTSPPAGYRVDHNRIQLGSGEQGYARAVEALKRWQQFDLGWVRIASPEIPVEQDAVVAVEIKAFGLWSLTCARIVYVINNPGDAKARFGFAYGTLPGHVEQGEERFLVEWKADDSVWYDIYAFSRPRLVMAKLGLPFCRMLQKRFAGDSMAAMRLKIRVD